MKNATPATIVIIAIIVFGIFAPIIPHGGEFFARRCFNVNEEWYKTHTVTEQPCITFTQSFSHLDSLWERVNEH